MKAQSSDYSESVFISLLHKSLPAALSKLWRCWLRMPTHRDSGGAPKHHCAAPSPPPAPGGASAAAGKDAALQE